MAHHAYFIAATGEQGIAHAIAHAETALGLTRNNNPDLTVMRYRLFSVEDARKITDMANRAPLRGEQKMIVLAATRFFHEAQNALLKVFEEPPAGTTLVLVVPAEGMLLPTLRSRLLPLPGTDTTATSLSPESIAFLAASDEEREKLLVKLVDRSKSDTDEIKQGARNEAVRLVEDLIRAAYARREETQAGNERLELTRLLSDLDRFLPILHERSAPIKLICEHLILVIPTSLKIRPV